MTEAIAIPTETTDLAAYTASEYSTLSVADKESRKVALNALNDAQSLNEVTKSDPDHVFEVIGVFTAPGVRRSRQQGQPDAPCTNTTIVTSDGKAYFTQSEGIRRCIDSYVASGVFEDGEIVALKIKTVDLPNGNTIKRVVLV